MKKILAVFALICAMLCVSASLSACGVKTSSATPTEDAAQTTTQDAAHSQSIVGSWGTELYGDAYVYTFNEDGTGTYSAAGKVMNLTYEVKNGIYYESFEGSSKPNERPYRIDGDKFIVKDTFGDEIIYTKK
ncbi:MAG: hypothetical protein IJ598_13875 [Ruminococcus sp.]|nr:hypothetical protein [Ruminococcus sp.]